MQPETGSPAPVSADSRHWDTRDVAQGDAFGYYREGICEAFMDLVPEAGKGTQQRFWASVESTPLPDGALNRVSAMSHQVLRTRREIAAAPADCFYLNFQTGGACRISQTGEQITLTPGTVGIFDSARPFVLEHRSKPSLTVSSFFVPHTTLAECLPGGLPSRPAMVSENAAVGHLVLETARTLSEGLDLIPADTAGRLFGVLLDLTALALGGETQVRADTASSRRAALFLKAKAIANRRVGDPGFGVAQCAAAAGISQRYLHKLFEAQGMTFGRYLLEQRLAKAATMLREPGRAHLPITTIAFDAGFSDMSHFGRAFRQRFDCTPTEWRQRVH